MWQNYALVKESSKLQKIPMNFDAMKEKSVDTLEHTFNPSIWKGKASRTLWAQVQPVIDSEFRLTMDTQWKLYLKYKTTTIKKNHIPHHDNLQEITKFKKAQGPGRVSGRWRGQQGHKCHVLMYESHKHK